MKRLKLVIAYDGSAYCGWQAQAEDGRQRTIQSEIERVISGMVKEEPDPGTRDEHCLNPIRVHGSGRTDSGVHAQGQVAHVDIPLKSSGINWKNALNAQLPPDIRVIGADWVGEDFHARFSAIGKEYSYTLWPSDEPVNPLLAGLCWKTRPLSLENMQSAATVLSGEHDFASFQNSGTDVKDTRRTIHSIAFFPGLAGVMTCPRDWPVVSIRFHGTGFLKQMVRNIIGLLVDIGLGRLAAKDVLDILKAAERAKNPCRTAPAHGLNLLRVIYP